MKSYRIEERGRDGRWDAVPGDSTGWERRWGERAMRHYAATLDYVAEMRLVCEQTGRVAARITSDGDGADPLQMIRFT